MIIVTIPIRSTETTLTENSVNNQFVSSIELLSNNEKSRRRGRQNSKVTFGKGQRYSFIFYDPHEQSEPKRQHLTAKKKKNK